MKQHQRYPVNPFDGLTNPVREHRDVRKPRTITESELTNIILAARSSPKTFGGLDGPRRALLYAVCFLTGMRSVEAAALTRRSLTQGDRGRWFVVLRTDQTKNSENARLPIPDDLAFELRTLADDLRNNEPLFPGSWSLHAARIIQRDAQAANIPVKVQTAEGDTFLMFHSLRHGYCRLLKLSGVHIATAQRLMRHSDIRLTTDTYGKLEDEALRQAADQAQRYANRHKQKPDLKPDHTPDETGQNMITHEETSECQESSEGSDLQAVYDDLGHMTTDEQERVKVERKRIELSRRFTQTATR